MNQQENAWKIFYDLQLKTANMITIEKHTLRNGLKVLINSNNSSQITAMNLIYNVGARDEDQEKTGFAHLFEHLMFGGSVNIPVYDEPLQKAGGENNAFTNNDFTNYYLTLPHKNLETGFWLESDRMMGLDFSEQSLAVQKNVVVEEFKQRYLNQPYGDAWLLLRPLAYRLHPYRWATIGKEISHIENAGLSDVKSFFYSFYGPDNAILAISGNVEAQTVLELSEKWFEPIEPRKIRKSTVPAEPTQTQSREQEVQRNVPYNSLYKAFHMPCRKDPDFYTADLISNILGDGLSARLYRSLVKKKKLFGEINAFITGSLDPGLLVISGTLLNGTGITEADHAINNELEKLGQDPIKEKELEKVKNRVETSLTYAGISNLTKAMNMAYFELLGDANLVNEEVDNYRSVTAKRMQSLAGKLFDPGNASTLYYLSKQKS